MSVLSNASGAGSWTNQHGGDGGGVAALAPLVSDTFIDGSPNPTPFFKVHPMPMDQQPPRSDFPYPEDHLLDEARLATKLLDNIYEDQLRGFARLVIEGERQTALLRQLADAQTRAARAVWFVGAVFALLIGMLGLLLAM